MAESFCALSRGKWPAQRHDGLPWSLPRDQYRSSMAGCDLFGDGVLGALCDFRGDLLQIVEGLGCAHWTSRRNPCFICKCSRADLYAFRRRHEAWTDEEYMGCVRATMTEYDLSEDQFAQVSRFMRCVHKWRGMVVLLVCCVHAFAPVDPRSTSHVCVLGHVFRCRAKAVLRPTPVNEAWEQVKAIGLRHGDTLQMGGAVRDPGSVHSDTDIHFEPTAKMVFFRKHRGPVRFRSPFVVVPGWGVSRIRLDVMHVMDLGTTSRFVALALHRLLAAGLWGRGGNAMTCMLGELHEWYAAEESKGRKLSRIGLGFSQKQLGHPWNPIFKGKAAECRHMLPWA